MFSRVASLAVSFILIFPLLTTALPVGVMGVKDVAAKPPLPNIPIPIPVLGPVISSLGSAIGGLLGGLLPSLGSPGVHDPRSVYTLGGLPIPVPTITESVRLPTPSLPTGELPSGTSILPHL